MKKIKQLFLSVCLSISLMFGCLAPSISAYASSGTGSVIDQFNGKLHDIMQDLTGTIMAPIAGAKDGIRQWINNDKSNYGLTQDQDADDLISGGYYYNSETNDNSISVDLSNAIIDYTQNYINSNFEYLYVYSYPSSMVINDFSTQTQYHAFLDILNDNEGNLVVYSASNYPLYVYEGDSFQLLDRGLINNNRLLLNVDVYTDWNIQNLWRQYTYNSSSGVYEASNDLYSKPQCTCQLQPPTHNPGSWGRLFNLNSTQFICYRTIEALRQGTEGIQGYYVSDSYNDFSHVSNTQIINDNSFVNTPTYGDVNSYINNYYTNNNSYPSITQITQYINNYQGGSGGGSGDDDDEDEESGFFELIKKVLDFFAKLFDTIAGFLADLVDSLGDVVTAVVDNILDIVGSIKDGIPNVAGDILSYAFPFLPEEFLLFIKFAITLGIIVGVIKLIRR